MANSSEKRVLALVDERDSERLETLRASRARDWDHLLKLASRSQWHPVVLISQKLFLNNGGRFDPREAAASWAATWLGHLLILTGPRAPRWIPDGLSLTVEDDLHARIEVLQVSDPRLRIHGGAHLDLGPPLCGIDGEPFQRTASSRLLRLLTTRALFCWSGKADKQVLLENAQMSSVKRRVNDTRKAIRAAAAEDSVDRREGLIRKSALEGYVIDLTSDRRPMESPGRPQSPAPQHSGQHTTREEILSWMDFPNLAEHDRMIGMGDSVFRRDYEQTVLGLAQFHGIDAGTLARVGTRPLPFGWLDGWAPGDGFDPRAVDAPLGTLTRTVDRRSPLKSGEAAHKFVCTGFRDGQLICGRADYPAVIASNDACRDELRRALGRARTYDPSIFATLTRRQALQGVGLRGLIETERSIPGVGNRAMSGIGISTLVVCQDRVRGPLVGLTRRSGTVAAYPDTWHVSPAGMFDSLTNKFDDEYSVVHNVLVEVLEELYARKELELLREEERDRNHDWFYEFENIFPLAQALMSPSGSDEVELRLLGVGIDLLNLRAELLTILLIRDPSWYSTARVQMKHHWENKRGHTIFQPFDQQRKRVSQTTDPGKWVPAGLVCASEGMRVASRLLGI